MDTDCEIKNPKGKCSSMKDKDFTCNTFGKLSETKSEKNQTKSESLKIVPKLQNNLEISTFKWFGASSKEVRHFFYFSFWK